MDYGMIGKIEKAKRYAEERDRIKVESLSVTFDGTNNPHTVKFIDSEWNYNTGESRNVLKQISLFPIIPYIRYSFSF